MVSALIVGLATFPPYVLIAVQSFLFDWETLYLQVIALDIVGWTWRSDMRWNDFPFQYLGDCLPSHQNIPPLGTIEENQSGIADSRLCEI
jgi:hypothetical protein